MGKKSISENIAKIAIIGKAPEWAKMIVDAIPDLKYDDYLKNYKTIWNIALPVSAFVMMRKFLKGDLEKTFVAHMSVGIARAINDRARKPVSANGELPEATFLVNEPVALESTHESKNSQIKDCLYLLNSSDFKLAMSRIGSLPKDQRNNLLASDVPDDRGVKDFFDMIHTVEKAASKKIINYSHSKSLTKVDYLRFILIETSHEIFIAWAKINFNNKSRYNRKRAVKKKYYMES